MRNITLLLSKNMAGAIAKSAKLLQKTSHYVVLVSNIKNDANAQHCDAHIYFDWDTSNIDTLQHRLNQHHYQPTTVICILESLFIWQHNIMVAYGLNVDFIHSLLQLSNKANLRKLENSKTYYENQLIHFNPDNVDFYPCVLKPISDSGGSRHVYTCKSKNVLRERIAALKKLDIPIDEHFIAEQYIQGIEYTVDGFITDSGFTPVLYSEKIDFDYLSNEDGAHIISPPITLTSRHQDQLTQQLQHLLKKVAIKKGWLHIEFRVQNNQPYIIEINPRCGGRMYSGAINYLAGIDPFNLSIQYQIEHKPMSLQPIINCDNYPYVLLINFKCYQGRIASHTPLAYFTKYQQFIDGYIISDFQSNTEKIENIFAELLIGGNSPSELLAMEAKIRSEFHYDVANNGQDIEKNHYR